MATNSMISKLSKNKAVKDFILEKTDDQQLFINTGALVLNILFSGRLTGGIPVGKISQIAAPSSLGKSFVGLKVAKNSQKMGEDWIVIYIDTEMAFDFDFAQSVGIDLSRLLVVQSNQIEDVQQQVMAISNELDKEERKKVLMVIDSWGGLVTSKTVNDATTGNDAADFTTAKKKNTFAKLLTGMGMTIFVINQVYDCGTDKMSVKTKEGRKSLADIEVGEEVLTTEGYQAVQDIFQYNDVPVYSIEMENGEILEFTENHKFLVERDGKQIWIPVSELVPDDDIQLYDDQRLYTDIGG